MPVLTPPWSHALTIPKNNVHVRIYPANPLNTPPVQNSNPVRKYRLVSSRPPPPLPALPDGEAADELGATRTA